jgi:hypothetical protein
LQTSKFRKASDSITPEDIAVHRPAVRKLTCSSVMNSEFPKRGTI